MKSSLMDLRLKQVSMAFCLTAVELQLLWLLKSSFSGGCCILASSKLTEVIYCVKKFLESWSRWVVYFRSFLLARRELLRNRSEPSVSYSITSSGQQMHH